MKPINKHTGIVAPLDVENVDTDAIVPKQFLKRITKSGFGEVLFYNWRFEDGNENPEFVLNQTEYRKSSILLARKNFGCGSSREHAPWALEDYGFRVIIAPSFADIFYSNCFKNGILPIVLQEEEVETLFRRTKQNPGYRLTVDLETQTITDEQEFNTTFEIRPYQKSQLLQGLDEVGATLIHDDKISSFEKDHKIYY
ncbi:3-isopropylmalate dehydratase small subunit [Bacillus sp. Marseille-Q3570]|uniref:3-isopropylmalate dehydratase small subunit n=1 Tax=Bacillus sp. Marseille-Q3570 TaxID=2963522 RepID=UPI0021B7729F|nr:3-isopropylmalate dehydratase small subunit [Bacillus sp. Marseille-Q3570]